MAAFYIVKLYCQICLLGLLELREPSKLKIHAGTTQ